MLRAGLRRLILANEVGGPGGIRRRAALCRAWPDTERYVFLDSMAALDALSHVRAEGGVEPLRVLVETGRGLRGRPDIGTATGLLEATTRAPHPRVGRDRPTRARPRSRRLNAVSRSSMGCSISRQSSSAGLAPWRAPALSC